MTAVSISATRTATFDWRRTRLFRFFRDAAAGSPLLSLHAVLMLAGLAATMALMAVDDRLFLGASVWHKPAKFFFSLAVQLATVAWALSLVPPDIRRWRSVRWASVLLAGAAWFEMAYIVFRASRGEASHFNDSDLFARVAYMLMGAGALLLTGTSGWIGAVIWRNRNGDLWREAAGLGLVLGAVLTTITATYLSSHVGGHWVGGEPNDGNGLRLFLWSTTGGDLRIAHFAGLHAMQAVPFAALSGRRSIVSATAIAIAAATALLFVQAVMGIPLFRS